MSNKTLKQRFEEKYIIKDKSCWEWIGSLSNNMYGSFWNGDTYVGAHRMSYELYKEDIPKDMCVLHTCDNPRCVNPDHLWIGTREDNNKDRSNKNRNADMQGEKHPQAKLTEQDIKEIRLLNSMKCFMQREIGEIYNITNKHVNNIVKFKIWKHV